MSYDKNSKALDSSLLSQWKKRNKKVAPSTLLPRPADTKAVASKGQERLWLLQEIYPDNAFYQYAHLYTIQGDLDKDLLTESFRLLIHRHEILRTNFIKSTDGHFVKPNPTPDFSSSYFDLRSLDAENKKSQSQELIAQESQRIFDLENDLLLRLSFIQLADDHYQVVLSIHHIIGDRWSLKIINEEVFTVYKKLKRKEPITQIPLTIQYTDYAYWQRERETKSTDLNFWLEHLAGELPLLDLPTDQKRPIQSSFRGNNLKRKLPSDLSEKLQLLAKELEATMYTLMLAAFKVLLYRYSNQSDIIIGSPFSNRDKSELEKLIGFFNETLALRTEIQQDWSFKELLANVKSTTLQAFEHKDVPFDEVVRALNIERQGSANPVFQAMFLYNTSIAYTVPELDLEIEEEIIDLKVSKFDLTLFVNDLNGDLQLSLEYATDLLGKESIHRLLQHFEILLESIVKDPSSSLSALPMIEAGEAHKILHEWNDTRVAYENYSGIHEIIESQVTLFPDRIALVFQDEKLTYAALNNQANAVAARLVGHGVKSNDPVGLYINRDVQMIVGILGILKAGAAYLPLDPEYPEDRIDFMVQDSAAKVILCQESNKSNLRNTHSVILSIEEAIAHGAPTNWERPSSHPDRLAYIIYTSGSTGRPKGVPIKHNNLLHSTQARLTFYPSNPKAFLLLSSFSFDSSVVGIFWTLCTGGNLILTPKRIEQDVHQLCHLIAKHEVSHTLMLPSLYNAILDHAAKTQLSSLSNVMVAGEACPFSLIKKHYQLLPDSELYNEYGPTEASVWCIAHKILANEKDFVPIGKPIPNTEAYILNAAHQPCPIGIAGELYIGGKGIANGYLNRPKLTKEKFVKHPFRPEQRLYKTGDLARLHRDGRIEFLGRVDHQVKIRGYRVEPDEIQNKILEYPGVKEALVIVHQSPTNDRKSLVAYLTGINDAEIDVLKYQLSRQLPAYMVPATIIVQEEFPKLPNGKINRKGLASPEEYQLADTSTYRAPQNAIEIALAEIWQEVIGVEKISVHDNFFALGGDSILSIQVVSKAREAGLLLRPNQLFEHQTVQALAQSIGFQSVQNNESIKSPILIERIDQYPLSGLQSAFLFNSQRSEKDTGLLHLEFTISGEVDKKTFERAWQYAAEKHDALRTHIIADQQNKPVQAVDRNANQVWEHMDWQGQPENEQEQLLADLRKSEEGRGLDLTTAPVSRLFLIQLDKGKNLFSWTCHHIFLDGWSCGIILRDALEFYKTISLNKEVNLESASNFLSFLNWNEKRDRQAENQFWSEALNGFSKPQLFERSSNTTPKFANEFLKISETESQKLQDFCQQINISISTLFQGIWALLLSKYFDMEDIVFGVTVSGRFVDFPNIAETSGLFMNVIPNRLQVDGKSRLIDWLVAMQKEQGKVRPFESMPLEQIKTAIQWPNHIALFNTLFVFGNFLKDGLKVGNLSVDHFQGGFSSGYPLTIRVNPIKALEFDFRYDTSQLSTAQINGIKDDFLHLINVTCNSNSTDSIKRVRDEINPLVKVNRLRENDLPVLETGEYVAPRSETESALCNIWQRLFNRSTISTIDNFFDLGGNSLMAIKLFSIIEQEMGEVLPPSSLFRQPTISGLASQIDGTSESVKLKKEDQTLIALRAEGDKAPLFCIHGGGAHVFFYKLLADHLPADRPVYSFQPPGLDDGGADLPSSIEAMAAYYISIIQSVQKEGPYHLLGTCFSNAVVLEISHQLRRQGEKIDKLFIIDSAPVHLFGNDVDQGSKTVSRFLDLLKRGDFSRIKRKIAGRLSRKNSSIKPEVIQESNSEKQLRITVDRLNAMYAEYHWNPIEDNIYFIRSREFSKRKDKNYHLTQWKKLAKGGISLHVVPGSHLTLFEAPEVSGLAQKISECIESGIR